MKMKVKVSNYISQFLVDNGIDTLFTVTGGGAMHLNDALGHKEGLNCLYNHHEQASAIAAEAYARRGESGDEAKACQHLNALRAKRIADYNAKSYSGDAVLDEVKKERVRELFGEGFRLTDLKRWGQGFTRSEAQDKNIITQANSTNYELLSMPASDPRWLWPIPQAEIDANPQIKDQQNDGY